MAQKYHITKPGSQWGPAETEICNVNDVTVPWADLLESAFEPQADDATLLTLCSNIERKVRMCDRKYLFGLYQARQENLYNYYTTMLTLTKLTASTQFGSLEEDPPPPAAVLARRSQRVIAKKPTQGMALDTSSQGVPKSTSLQSISSIKSDDQGVYESTTEEAFSHLLKYIMSSMMTEEDPILDHKTNHTRRVIQLKGAPKGCTVIDDGCIMVAKTGLAVINLESKTREGSTGADVYEKLFAQEFAEVLAVMTKRLDEALVSGDRSHPSFRTVYSISIHHRRVYLTRVIFSPGYLRGLLKGHIMDEQVLVERSSTSLRMDDVVELRQLVSYLVQLLRQLTEYARSGFIC